LLVLINTKRKRSKTSTSVGEVGGGLGFVLRRCRASNLSGVGVSVTPGVKCLNRSPSRTLASKKKIIVTMHKWPTVFVFLGTYLEYEVEF